MFVLSGVLIIWAALTGVGATLRALDYLAAAANSATVRAVAMFLFSRIGAAVTLLVVIAILAAAFRRPADPARTSDVAPPPNIIVLKTGVLPIDQWMRLGGATDSLAAIVRFRNDADPKRHVGPLMHTRAQLQFTSVGNEPLHADGIWADDCVNAIDFAVGGSHYLIVAIQTGDQTSVPEIWKGDIRGWNISRTDAFYVDVRLLGGVETTVVRDFRLRLRLRPTFGLDLAE